MPVIAAFFGMLIRVFHSDHDPPHLHVQYGEFEAIIEIKTGKLKGKFPKRLERLLQEWLKLRREEVMKAWVDACDHKLPRRIKPLDV